MSKEITVKGTYHRYENQKVVERPPAYLYASTFYNGQEFGKSVQITIDSEGEYKYIHITKRQCLELARELSNIFDIE